MDVDEQKDEEVNVNLAEERIDLVDCKRELHFNQRDVEGQVERDRDLLSSLGVEIRTASRRNFDLEKNLAMLDKQIHLLIENMIHLAELNGMAPAADQNQKSHFLGMSFTHWLLWHIQMS